MDIDKLSYNQIAENIILCHYDYNSEEYGRAVNKINCLSNLEHSTDIANKMASTNDFSVLCALAFIISETHYDELLMSHHELRPIIRRLIAKNCYRANFDLISVSVFFIEQGVAEYDDYLSYLDLIKSDNYIVQFLSVSNLLRLNEYIFRMLNELSDLDFSIFFEFPKEINKSWFKNYTKNKSFIDTLIVLTAVYYHCRDKKFVFELTDKSEPYIFDFLYVYVP